MEKLMSRSYVTSVITEGKKVIDIYYDRVL